MIVVFDCETDGLNPTKIHCLSVNVGGKIKSTTDYNNMRKFLTRKDIVLVAHNGIRYDKVALEKVLGIKIEAKVVCSLALSWYLEPKRVKHGLESWGEDLGFAKPPIDDWENLSIEEYINRCESDVEINTRLWERQWKQLLKLYGSEEEAWRLIDYLSFKMDCAREQEEVKWKLDVERCRTVRDKLEAEKALKTDELREAMPKVVVTKPRTRPAKMYIKGKVGVLSVAGEKWVKLLREHNLPEDYEGVVDEVWETKEPNPGSTDQVKSWLYSFGWVPETFEFKRNKETGEVRQIPQVNIKGGGGICHSIKKLYDKEPKFKVLDGLSVLTHRISILNGFLSNVDVDGYVQAKINGLTNTLRFKHSVVVNLPGVDKPHGADIRGCLVAPEGYELGGSDMSSLEDRTKQHFMWPHDPAYVREMMTPDFDPHLALAEFAGAMTTVDVKKFKEADDEFKHTGIYKALKVVRQTYKKANYTAVYGAGDAAVARAAEVPLNEGAKIREAYWKKNWSVVAIAEEQIVKTCNGIKWLFNPVSKLWYALRHEKDRFSTLNQGTGVWCFDTYVKHVRKNGPPLVGQFHDEIVALLKIGSRDKMRAHCQRAIDKTNAELNLNRELGFSIDFGDSYADIH